MFAMASSAAKKSKLEETEEKRKTRYSKEYEKEYDFVRKCNCGVRGSYYKFHCMACNIDLSCASGDVTTSINIIFQRGESQGHL